MLVFDYHHHNELIIPLHLDADDRFGPTVVGCRDDFDFTLMFEQSILSLIPSVVLLIVSVARITQLYRCRIKTVTTPLRFCKPVSAVCYDIK
jgi:ATP-binding cassette subfamily C (CFTR/MRP) protein 1